MQRNTLLVLALLLFGSISCRVQHRDTLAEQMTEFFEQSLKNTYGDLPVSELYRNFFDSYVKYYHHKETDSFPVLKMDTVKFKEINQVLFSKDVFYDYYSARYIKVIDSIPRCPTFVSFNCFGTESFCQSRIRPHNSIKWIFDSLDFMENVGAFPYAAVAYQSTANKHDNIWDSIDKQVVRKLLAVAWWKYLCESNGILFIYRNCFDYDFDRDLLY
jgi:hypothetical protein